MTAADLLVDELQARGVQYIATLNGHGLDPFYLACERAGMRMIDVRNEQAAGYMAEVTGRLSRSVGVCAVSGAVAHANALTGVLNAWFDGAPMLLITGITPLQHLGWGNFQDFNPVPMSEPICKYARLLDVPGRVPQILHEAFNAATTGRPGPVHLSLPIDIAGAEVDPDSVRLSHIRSGEVRPEGAADSDALQQATDLLKQAQRPLLVAGSGVFYSQGEAALAEFVQQQKIPVTVPIWDRGSIVQPLDEYMGVLGAAAGGPKLLPDADLILLVGADFDYRVGQISKPAIASEAKILRIHADPTQLRQGLEAHLSIQGSPATVLKQLTSACEGANCAPAEDWLSESKDRLNDHQRGWQDAASRLSGCTSGHDVVSAIQEVMSDDTILLVDGGNIGQWFHQVLGSQRYPGHWLTCGASGVVGWGLPGAMAARAHQPDGPVILLSGDGAFTFTLGELECASRQGLHFVAVVADDEQWGISVSGHIGSYGHPLNSTLGPTRLDLVAEGLGCRGVRIEQQSDLVPALQEALKAEAVTVIHVPIVPSSPA
jgi:acetolactate synthase-1/2/3 large subunit